ncbi:MAG TPA: archease [Geobacterales bacterium]|nr:archease [Geobacterales bacterium]
MNEGYRYLEDIAIADLAFEVQAKNLENLFKLAGKAVSNAMVLDLNSIKKEITKDILIESEDLEILLYNFLEEIIYYKDTEGLVFSDFDVSIETNGKKKLKAKAYGEKLDYKRHETLVDVKAVTMHLFELKQKNGFWYARIVLDV